MRETPPRELEPLAPSNAPTAQVAPSPTREGRVWFTFEDERGTRWRVVDIERVERRPRIVPLASRRATHRQFIVVGKHPQAYRYEFRPGDDEEHALDPTRLGMQLYLGRRVTPRRRTRG